MAKDWRELTTAVARLGAPLAACQIIKHHYFKLHFANKGWSADCFSEISRRAENVKGTLAALDCFTSGAYVQRCGQVLRVSPCGAFL